MSSAIITVYNAASVHNHNMLSVSADAAQDSSPHCIKPKANIHLISRRGNIVCVVFGYKPFVCLLPSLDFGHRRIQQPQGQKQLALNRQLKQLCYSNVQVLLRAFWS